MRRTVGKGNEVGVVRLPQLNLRQWAGVIYTPLAHPSLDPTNSGREGGHGLCDEAGYHRFRMELCSRGNGCQGRDASGTLAVLYFLQIEDIHIPLRGRVKDFLKKVVIPFASREE